MVRMAFTLSPADNPVKRYCFLPLLVPDKEARIEALKVGGRKIGGLERMGMDPFTYYNSLNLATDATVLRWRDARREW